MRVQNTKEVSLYTMGGNKQFIRTEDFDLWELMNVVCVGCGNDPECQKEYETEPDVAPSNNCSTIQQIVKALNINRKKVKQT